MGVYRAGIACRATELPVWGDAESKGIFVDHWGKGNSVPDITRTESQLWLMFLCGTYIRLGCEALHMGQVNLMGMADHDWETWDAFLQKVRAFARKESRRGWVLLDAHTPHGGLVARGKSLLDFNSFPLRIKEIPEKPQQGILQVGYLDALFGRSKGCMTPSGWQCESLPYLVEFDNFGISRSPGVADTASHFIWGMMRSHGSIYSLRFTGINGYGMHTTG